MVLPRLPAMTASSRAVSMGRSVVPFKARSMVLFTGVASNVPRCKCRVQLIGRSISVEQLIGSCVIDRAERFLSRYIIINAGRFRFEFLSGSCYVVYKNVRACRV